jgi:hypothetical protein
MRIEYSTSLHLPFCVFVKFQMKNRLLVRIVLTLFIGDPTNYMSIFTLYRDDCCMRQGASQTDHVTLDSIGFILQMRSESLIFPAGQTSDDLMSTHVLLQ